MAVDAAESPLADRSASPFPIVSGRKGPFAGRSDTSAMTLTEPANSHPVAASESTAFASASPCARRTSLDRFTDAVDADEVLDCDGESADVAINAVATEFDREIGRAHV